ncbi:class I SAM-dependent methyltransferase [bacterium NHP-B]|nr:class I SAM-dependent methyltransferase [bacterium NHP-B]
MNMHNEENYMPTLNQMGYVTKIMDEYSQEFIQRTKGASKAIADLGVGYGFTSKRLLEQGAQVYANDIDPRHLDVLKNSCGAEERARLHLIPGKLPEAFTPETNSLSGVLASRCFHFLTGEEIGNLVKAMYDGLCPGGLHVWSLKPHT